MTNLLPTCYIVSNPNILAIRMIGELLNKNCRVIVITNHKSEFEKYVTHSADLKIIDFRERAEEIPAYLFVIQGMSARDAFFPKQQLKTIFDFSESYSPKTQIILPYVVTGETKKLVENSADAAKKVKNRNLEIIYVGEVYGAGMDIAKEGFVPSIFRKIWQRQIVQIPFFDFEIFVIDVYKAIDELLQGIFSYGFREKEVVITTKVKVFGYLREIQKIMPNFSFISNEGITAPVTISNFNFIDVSERFEYLKETFAWLMATRPATPQTKQAPKMPKVNLKSIKLKVNKKGIKSVVYIAIIIFWVVSLPFLIFLMSTLFLRLGFERLVKSDVKTANTYFVTASRFATLSKNGFFFLETPRKMALVVDEFAKTGEKGIMTFQSVESLSENILNAGEYDLGSAVSKIRLDVDDLYKQISFLEADMKTIPAVKSFLPEYDVEKVRQYAENLKPVSENLAGILGQNGKKKYVVLIQDEKELRPTGGFIGSFGLFSFQSGKLIDESFYDTATIDKRLNGHIDPPDPIRNYLGETNWYLKDANWESDFRTSATKAEWFLEKEIGERVDGVIAINLGFYNDIKKINGDFMKWGQKMMMGLATKDVQIFMNDSNLSDSLENLKWDGGISGIGMVEANLGLNKVNGNISRNTNLTVDYSGTNLVTRMEVNFSNSSKTEAYRTYVRAIVPVSGVNFEKVSEAVNGSTRILNPDVTEIAGRSEAGVLVQIPPAGRAQVVFMWNQKKGVDFGKHENVTFSLRKQPGVAMNPTNINFILPSTLTKANITRYNTNLTEDFSTVLSF